ncbi:MAG: hypothetical protein HOD92_24320 [Deltaproteobacteria bacterium]|jgi:Fe-S cluster biogenesis protein NfuA/rhodanese-related sulfurtransferase|nr:hypothetical protein [Deltaproteobacteria bacterium]
MEQDLLKKVFEAKSYGISADDCLAYRRNENEQSFVIDLRSKDEYDQECLMGSYSLPANYLQDYVTQMPSHSKIILYADDEDTVIESLKLLIEHDFEDVQYVVGGFSKIQEALKASDQELFLTDFPPDQWERQISQVLADKVLPVLEADGGGLSVDKVENDKVFIQFQGACNGCPSATSGELNFIKNTLGIALNHTIDVEVL